MILLITLNPELAGAVQAALPGSMSLQPCASMAQMKELLAAKSPPELNTLLILLDGQSAAGQLAPCLQLRQHIFETEQVWLPVIGLLEQPAQREALLSAGADDYLLLPLLPVELKNRLMLHLNRVGRGFGILAETMHQANRTRSARRIDQGLRQLAAIFNAPAAWLLLAPGDRADLTLAGSYNLPPLYHRDPATLGEETLACLHYTHHPQTTYRPKVIECSYLTSASPSESNGLTHHLSIPLVSNVRLVGLLQLAFAGPPGLSAVELQRLYHLGRHIGMLLNLFNVQEETQISATQNAFMVLVARMLNEKSDLTGNLALILELATPILDAAWSDIWLLTDDEQALSLAASLSMHYAGSSRPNYPKGRGLIGWVGKHGQTLQIQVPTTDPRFDPALDHPAGISPYALLAAPLYHHDSLLGVLAFYRDGRAAFSNQDATLIEGIAALTASAIADSHMMQELRDYADQQHLLNEMSQQMAKGLDLPITLERALHWLTRLSNTEIGILWLLEAGPEKDRQNYRMRVVAASGIELSPTHPITVTLEQDIAHWVAGYGQPLVINDPATDPRLRRALCRRLGLNPRNLISLPLTHYDEPIGVVCLLNKRDGSFEPTDQTLLATASDIAAVAVANAQLHTQALALMAEREQLHRHMLQTERLATVGRLTASLSHEINNPMQAIQGALSLALEELNDPEALQTYLELSQQESGRVVTVVNRMRQIYRPQTETAQNQNLNFLIQEVADIAQKELRRQKVTLRLALAPTLPPVQGVGSQLHLVLLSLLLNLGDVMGRAGGGSLHISTHANQQWVAVEFSGASHLLSQFSWLHLKKSPTDSFTPEVSLGIDLSRDILSAHNGAIRYEHEPEWSTCIVEFPASVATNDLPENL